MANISPSRNSLRNSAARSMFRYCSPVSLETGCDATGLPPASLASALHRFPLLLPCLFRLAVAYRIGWRARQRLAARRHDRLETLHPREPFEIGFHHRPWRGWRAGPEQHLLHRHVVAIPFFAVAPVLRGQLPALVRRVLALFEAAQLLFRTDLQPELYHHRPGIRQLALEIVDLAIGPSPGLLGGESLHALHQHAAI